MVLTLMVSALITAAAFGRNYNLDESETINLSGIDEVVFNLKGVSCSLCVRTLDILSDLQGNGSGSNMTLSLGGRISSNREKAVPSLIVDQGSRTVTVQLFPDRQTFFGLSQSGTARFEAILPASFDGVVTVRGSSDDISVSNFELTELDLESSSGDLDVENLQGRVLAMKVSSGEFRGSNIVSGESLTVESSSGDIELGGINAPTAKIEASSGDISITDIASADLLKVKASSGRITVGDLSGTKVEMDSSSGKIEIEQLEAGDVQIEVSSGDVQLGRVVTELIDIRLSSGDLEIDVLDSDFTEIKTSGETDIKSGRGEIKIEGSSGEVTLAMSEFDAPVDVDVSSGDITVTLPKGSAFDANLDTSSGRIRSDFPVMGDLAANGDELNGTVNGGGNELALKTSSGNIKLLAR